MDIELLNAILNAGGSGFTIWFLIRLESRMAQRDQQMWALLEWLARQPRIDTSQIPPSGFPPAVG